MRRRLSQASFQTDTLPRYSQSENCSPRSDFVEFEKKSIHSRELDSRILVANVKQCFSALGTVSAVVADKATQYLKSAGDASKSRGMYHLRDAKPRQAVDGPILKRAAFAACLIIIALAALFYGVGCIRSSGSSASFKPTPEIATANTISESPISNSEKSSAVVDATLDAKERQALAEMLDNMMQFRAQNMLPEMEGELHRGLQRFCVPYLSSKFKLNKAGLTNLESEMAILIDVATRLDFTMKDQKPDKQVVVVEQNGKISFIGQKSWLKHGPSSKNVATCPLVTQLLELSTKNLERHRRKEDGSVTASTQTQLNKQEIAERIDDKNGNIQTDIATIIMRLGDLFSSTGQCAKVGQLLKLDEKAANMKLTDELKAVLRQVVTMANSGSGTMKTDLIIHSSGIISAGVKNYKAEPTSVQCNQLSEMFEALYKERTQQRIATAALSLLARLWNSSPNDMLSTLVFNA